MLGIEHQRIDDALTDNRLVKRTSDIVRYAQLIGALHINRVAFGGNHDDWHVVNPMVLVHHRKNAEAVQLRHDHIQQNEVDMIVLFRQNLDCLNAVFGFKKIISVAQNAGQYGAVHFRIIND